MAAIFLLISIGILPLVLWGGYFYLKNPGKESVNELFGVFLLGTLSIIPAILFHRWLLADVLNWIATMWPLFNQPFLQAVLQLALLTLFIIAFVSLFALLNAFVGAFKGGGNHHSHKKSIYRKLYNFTPLLFVFILLVLVDGGSNLLLKSSFILSLTGSVILFAIMEEYFKYIINPFLVRRKIHAISTAMVHALYVGLAFAFVENLLFFYVNQGKDGFESLILYRSFFTTLLHIGASGILGYFYGLTLFSDSILANYEIEKGSYNLPHWLRPFIKKGTAYQSISISQGFFIAAAVHASFNLLLHQGSRLGAALLVSGLTVASITLLNSKSSQTQYGLVGTSVMPEIDFEALRRKITMLKELNKIQNTTPI